MLITLSRIVFLIQRYLCLNNKLPIGPYSVHVIEMSIRNSHHVAEGFNIYKNIYAVKTEE